MFRSVTWWMSQLKVTVTAKAAMLVVETLTRYDAGLTCRDQ